MSQDLFIPGRPLQQTSIACLMQRHRWDHVRSECSCCGIGRREFVVQMNQARRDADDTHRNHHTDVLLYTAVNLHDPFTPHTEVFGKYDDYGTFWIVGSRTATWSRSAPAKWKHEPNGAHRCAWFYRYIGPPCDKYSGRQALGRYVHIGGSKTSEHEFHIQENHGWQRANPLHWEWFLLDRK